ncbi:Abi family protein [Lactobacillus mulieris]|uniref:Abi family protein n=2 Tax=Lactobacillus mulieris TaxID=2508708 RepID=A0ABT4K2V5_9LACO|nr:Abi family protein [Lactobacillus mulieris]MCZ3622317.1 Abi family protein [Lactobacillus mulieris]MCZ3690692.1 Abi family protein [Lactobacillus mulieris]MCZ3696650.1 Abi family protein [Lactobacillus mulieris]MCZ3702838.1 Abi family protein [Lactobacillus mulieris]MCZ3705912.1 Abi family protein [Lactobacillus mulieris]
MLEKGITFNYMTVSQAKKVLDRNYYFNFASYRKLFHKDANGKYIDLDFAFLQDLSAFDIQLREFLLDLTLDVERFAKGTINSVVSKNPLEDGYKIVQDFKVSNTSSYNIFLNQLKCNSYYRGIYKKYYKNMPVWTFLDFIPYGTLSRFLDFTIKREGCNTKKLQQIATHLKFCKNIRNAAAHGNPFLINIFSPNELIDKPISSIISLASEIGISRQDVRDEKVNDLVALFYLHKKIQDKDLIDRRLGQARELLKRLDRHKDWYSKNAEIQRFKLILSKLVDYLGK